MGDIQGPVGCEDSKKDRLQGTSNGGKRGQKRYRQGKGGSKKPKKEKTDRRGKRPTYK